MAKVTGIGGVFFRARDPEALSAWYTKHLGLVVGAGNGPPWHQDAGYTVFAPFSANTDYFPAETSMMLNFRVDDLDALTAALTAAGIEVRQDPEWDAPEIGRFARIHDPEGNPIELWEPAG